LHRALSWHGAGTRGCAMTAYPLRGSPRVLIVDDDDRIRALAEVLVRRAGYVVLTAACPGEAIEVLKANTDIGVVVSDIVLPEMTGFDFSSEVKKFAPGIRFVFMSGFPEDQFRAPISEPFVPKPFTVGSLGDAIAAALA
jgi:two-component system cell cycle sensor histidine kinase/response regulator CckA